MLGSRAKRRRFWSALRVFVAAPGDKTDGGDEEGEEGAYEPDGFAEGEGVDLEEADGEKEEAGAKEPEAHGGPVADGAGPAGVGGEILAGGTGEVRASE